MDTLRQKRVPVGSRFPTRALTPTSPYHALRFPHIETEKALLHIRVHIYFGHQASSLSPSTLLYLPAPHQKISWFDASTTRPLPDITVTSWFTRTP